MDWRRYCRSTVFRIGYGARLLGTNILFASTDKEDMPRKEREQMPPSVASNSHSSMKFLKEYKLRS